MKKNWHKGITAFVCAVMLFSLLPAAVFAGEISYSERVSMDHLTLDLSNGEPVTENPAEDEPIAEEIIEEPVADEPAEDEPVQEEIDEEPAEEPAEEEPTEEEPVAEEPAEEELPEEEPAEETLVYVTSGVTDLRQSADGLSPILTTVAGGTELKVLSRGSEWMLVETDQGVQGYVYLGSGEEVSAKKVAIFSSRKSRMTLGERVTLSSHLEGFEDCESIAYQWQCDKGDGQGFQDVPGAVEPSYSFSADLDSLSWSWRLKVDAE